MNRRSPLSWLRNISIAKKLYFTVGCMALLIALELATLFFAVKTLSSVRAYVGAEGLWSKAQKDAVYNLQKYAHSRDEKDYQAFLGFLRVPLGDRKVLIELSKKHPNLSEARKGFLEGRIHPDDIDGAIKLFRRFRHIYYIDKAIGYWVTGDRMIARLEAMGAELHREISSAQPDTQKINQLLGQIYPLNEQLTHLEDEFSFTLGAGSRWLTDLILKLLFGLVLTVEICGFSLTIFVSRGISRGLKEIIRSADTIAAGDFSTRAAVYSKDEIGILANAFNEMTDKLENNISALKRSEEELKVSKNIAEQSAVVKENFLANMSHEIRTPMNAVIGFTHLLENTALNANQQEFVRAIKISGQSLMTIINDILDYSKIESGMVVIEQVPFSVKNTLESLQVLLMQKATAKNLELKFGIDEHIPDVLIGDPTRLMQILLNLTDNAIKFTEKGGIGVYAFLKEQAADSVTLEYQIIDSGRGIPPDKLSAIFERFTQASSETTRKYGGTGLGLSIAKSLVELQNGRMQVTSEVDAGSIFSFTISYQKPGSGVRLPGEGREPVSDASRIRQLNILLAEDNKLNQSLAVHVLIKFGFDVVIAENGRIAVEKLQQERFDLVLMDMQMPEMDGYEATRVIRNELKMDIPILALTASAMIEEREKCLQMGMNEYISKPFNPDELYEKIASFFK